eukprot:6971594-Pyramimonas_sp.AAC.1
MWFDEVQRGAKRAAPTTTTTAPQLVLRVEMSVVLKCLLQWKIGLLLGAADSLLELELLLQIPCASRMWSEKCWE